MDVSGHRIECARAEDFLARVPNSSVGLIVTDPPYFRVKSEAWDRAWKGADAFVAWMAQIADQWLRVLRPNGTLYVFASSRMAARVECMLAERFDVVASCVWVKADSRGHGRHDQQQRDALRSYFPQTERVIVCEHKGADSTALGSGGYAAKCDEARGFVFEPLRAYLAGEVERAGLTVGHVDRAWKEHRGTKGQMVGHWITRSQWALPTRVNYEWLRGVLNASGGDYLRRDYDDLRREYDDLRREYDDLRREFDALRRPFCAHLGRHHTDVWTYPTVDSYHGKHPCEKPAEMAEDIVRVSSRPGDVVLDTFAGSGAFLRAAARLGRVAIGCDMDPRWAAATAEAVDTARPRIVESCGSEPEADDLPLFRGIA